jgi:PAS domain S-box-containing protein
MNKIFDISILDQLLEGCQLIDFNFRYLYINEVAAKQGQRPKESYIGRTMMELYPGNENSNFFFMVKRCMNERQPIVMENEFKFPNGESGWFELKMEPVPAGIFILSIDISEHKQVQKQIETQLQWMKSLHTIDIAIANTLEIQMTLSVLVEAAVTQLGVDAVDVMLFKPSENTLEYASGKGFCTDRVTKGSVKLGEGLAGQVALKQQRIHISNLAEIGNKITRSSLHLEESFVSYSGIPLIAKGQLKGVLEVYHHLPLNPDEEWYNFFETIAGQAAMAIDNAQLVEGIQRSNKNLSLAYDATIEGWSRALDLRDQQTEGHSRRVTNLTVKLAKAIGMSEDEIIHARRGALLHDMGKLGVPDGILLKPDKLTDEEYTIMRQHPQYAFNMLSDITYLQPALDIPYCHHERWDGSGYPRGLKGKQIPIAARLFSVVDVWDALLTSRPYHAGWSKEKTQQYIRLQSGIQFDPKAVELFLSIINDAEDYSEGNRIRMADKKSQSFPGRH